MSKEVGTRARSDCSKVLWKVTEEDREATTTCKQRLLLSVVAVTSVLSELDGIYALREKSV